MRYPQGVPKTYCATMDVYGGVLQTLPASWEFGPMTQQKDQSLSCDQTIDHSTRGGK